MEENWTKTFLPGIGFVMALALCLAAYHAYAHYLKYPWWQAFMIVGAIGVSGMKAFDNKQRAKAPYIMLLVGVLFGTGVSAVRIGILS